MITKKYLGLFVIVCTIIIGTPGVIDVDAAPAQHVEHVCIFDASWLTSWMCPQPPPKGEVVSPHELWKIDHCRLNDMGVEYCDEDDPYEQP